MYSLVVRGSSTGTKNFASLYVAVIETDKKCIVIEQYQFLKTFVSFTCKIFQYF